jgi:hypothetical protein
MGFHDDDSIFLTQEEHDFFLLSQIKVNEEEEETKQQAFENAIMEVHKMYNLRNKKNNDNPTKKATETKKITEANKTSYASLKKVPEKNCVESSAKRNPELSQRSYQTEVAYNSKPNTSAHGNMIEKPEVQRQIKTSTTFSMEGELAKLKIHIPLPELMRKNAYRSQVIKELRI